MKLTVVSIKQKNGIGGLEHEVKWMEESTMLKLSEETRFYAYLSGMFGFLLGIIITILIISIEHKLF